MTSDPVTDMIIDCNEIRENDLNTWRCVAPYGHEQDKHYFLAVS